MFEGETVTIIEEADPPAEADAAVATIDAAQAEASAQAAQEAALLTTATAATVAAQADQNAADQMRAYQEDMATWRAELASVTQSQAAYSSEVADLRTGQTNLADQISLILAKLQPPEPDQASLTDSAPSEPEAAADQHPATEPSQQQERRRAHRWI